MQRNLWNKQTLLTLAGMLSLFAGLVAFFYVEGLTGKPIYLYAIVAVAVIVLAVILVYVYLLAKGKIQQTGPDYRTLFYLGFVFFIFGSASNSAFYAIGLVFVIVGLVNRKKWKPEKKWSEISPAQRNFKITAIAILFFLLIGGFVMWYLAGQKKQVTNFEECVAAGNSVMESYPRQCRHGEQTFVEILSALFNDDHLGISFSYPISFGEVNVIIAEPGKRPGGEIGKKIVGTFSQFSGFEFGGITEDFRAGREGLITDTRGFIKEDEAYYFKFVANKDYRDYEILPLKVIEKDFGTILILNDQSFAAEREGVEGPVLGVGEGNYAGLLNLKGEEFPGLILYNRDAGEFSLQEFESLLDSISVYLPTSKEASWKQDDNKARAAQMALVPLSFPATVVDVTYKGCEGCYLVTMQRTDSDQLLSMEFENWTLKQGLEQLEVDTIVTSADDAPAGSMHNLPVPDAVAAVRTKIANDLGIREGLVIIMTAYEKTWTNGCLDLEEYGEMCTEALVRGYEVSAEAQGKSFVYHTNADGSVLRENK